MRRHCCETRRTHRPPRLPASMSVPACQAPAPGRSGWGEKEKNHNVYNRMSTSSAWQQRRPGAPRSSCCVLLLRCLLLVLLVRPNEKTVVGHGREQSSTRACVSRLC